MPAGICQAGPHFSFGSPSPLLSFDLSGQAQISFWTGGEELSCFPIEYCSWTWSSFSTWEVGTDCIEYKEKRASWCLLSLSTSQGKNQSLPHHIPLNGIRRAVLTPWLPYRVVLPGTTEDMADVTHKPVGGWVESHHLHYLRLQGRPKRFFHSFKCLTGPAH